MKFYNLISDNKTVRFLASLFFTWGDDIRPVVQKPIVKKIIGNDKFNIALDDGCGRGLYTNHLTEKTNKVFAIDISLDNLKTQKRRMKEGKRIFFILASAENLPFRNKSFDLILCTEVLEHLDDDKKAIGEIARVVKDKGKAIISVPVPPAPIDDKAHKRTGYTLEEIGNLLNQNNLKILNYKYCMFGVSRFIIKFINWWTKYFKIPLPSVIKIPLYVERMMNKKQIGLPYDLIMELVKQK
jgi:ubiquinone/menaquinone biosynthesis C-methylase UbiE